MEKVGECHERPLEFKMCHYQFILAFGEEIAWLVRPRLRESGISEFFAKDYMPQYVSPPSSQAPHYFSAFIFYTMFEPIQSTTFKMRGWGGEMVKSVI